MRLREALERTKRGDGEPHVWRPSLFDAGDAVARERVARLLGDGEVRTVHDTIEAQLLELMEARDPAPASAAGLSARIREHLAGRPLDEYGVWAFYPWSGRLLHLLPPDELLEVRTSRNRYKITREGQRTLAAATIAVVGLSVGHASAVTLALEGIGGCLRLADFDRLSLANLNRIRTGLHRMGLNKAVLTAREIVELNPYQRLEVWEEGVTRERVDALLEGVDLLVEECDDLAMKVLLRERARERRIPVLMETSDRGMIDVERFDLEPRRPLLHGRLSGVRSDELEGLSTQEKVPYVLDIIGVETVSAPFAASLVEIDRTVKTWPQLGSAVCLGGALNADTARRLLLGEAVCSGRFYVDPGRLVGVAEARAPEPSTVPSSERRARAAQPASAAPGEPPSRRGDVPLEAVRALVSAAVKAPSGGNAQPWRFELEGDTLRCFIDEARAGTFLDFEGRASILACGAACENAVLIAPSLGLSVSLEVLPQGLPRAPGARQGSTDPGGEAEPPADALQPFALTLRPTAGSPRSALARQIEARVTNRRLGPRRPLPPGTAEALTASMGADASEGVRLRLVTDPEALDELGRLIGEGERLRLLHPRMHAEMMGELRWTAEEASATADGLELDSLELSATDRAGMRVAARPDAMALLAQVGGGRALGEPSEKSVAAASALGLLTFEGEAPAGYFEAGRAVQRVWLTAQERGLALQPMSALPYLFARLRHGGEGLSPEERETLGRLRERYVARFRLEAGEGEALLFRLAVAPPARRAALRRPLESALLIRG